MLPDVALHDTCHREIGGIRSSDLGGGGVREKEERRRGEEERREGGFERVSTWEM